MAELKNPHRSSDLGARLAEVADLLDNAVDVLADTLAEIRRREEEHDDHGAGRPDDGTGGTEGAG
jgi:hypothetical protein